MNRLLQTYQHRWPLHEWLTEGIDENRLDWLVTQVIQKGHYHRQFPVEITKPFAEKRGLTDGRLFREMLQFLDVSDNSRLILLSEPEPSRCDIRLVKKLQELLEMLDVRLLDHFIVAGTETVSMAERGLV